MSDGIKIRELDPTTTISTDDVLVVDKESIGDNSITYYIRYGDVKSDIFSGDITLEGSLSVGGDLTVGGDTTLNGRTEINNDLYVTGSINSVDLNISGNTNLKLDDLSDVEVGSAADKHYLMYDGTKWVSNELNLDSIGGGSGTQTDDYILLSGGQEPITFVVTVGPKSDWNQFKGIGSDDCFYIDGKESPILMLPPNRTFIFDQSDPSNAGYRMGFFEEQQESVFQQVSPAPGMSYEGTPGITGAKSTITFTSTMDAGLLIDEQTPAKLYYKVQGSTSGNTKKYMGSVIHNTGSSIKEEIGDIGGGGGGGGWPFTMDLSEALEDLHTRLEALES